MARRFGLVIVPTILILLLVAANVAVRSAAAHGISASSGHWNKGGSYIRIDEYNYASNYAPAELARQDRWNKVWILYNYNSSVHTDISVFDGDWGNVGWLGMSSIENMQWNWACWCYSHITHGHARYNTYYRVPSSTIQGVFCHEVWHLYGFTHDDSGGCVTGTTNTLSSHNAADFINFYLNH